MASTKEYIRHLHTVYTNSLTEASPITEPPNGALKVNMHLHQKIVLNKMEKLESDLTTGMELNNERIFYN